MAFMSSLLCYSGTARTLRRLRCYTTVSGEDLREMHSGPPASTKESRRPITVRTEISPDSASRMRHCRARSKGTNSPYGRRRRNWTSTESSSRRRPPACRRSWRSRPARFRLCNKRSPDSATMRSNSGNVTPNSERITLVLRRNILGFLSRQSSSVKRCTAPSPMPRGHSQTCDCIENSSQSMYLVHFSYGGY